MAIKFLGIEVERKTDVLALSAFLLALAGVLYQLVGFVQGPDVVLFPPEQVLIFPKEIASQEYVVFAAPMAYVNKGQPGYNAALKSESIKFSFGDKHYEQKWQDFITSGSAQNKLVYSKQADAHPLAINAGSTISHETRFSPRSVPARGEEGADAARNYLKWNDFITAISGLKALDLELVGEIYDKKPVKVNCKIYITKDFISYLRENKWHAPTCWPD